MQANKTTSALLVIILGIVAAWQKPAAPKEFILTGNVTDFKDTIVFLGHGTFSKTQIDSAKVTDGHFTFKGKTPEPLPGMLFSRDYRLRLDLYVDQGPIKIEGTMDDLKVAGSAIVNEYEAFNKVIMANRKRVNGIYTEAYNAKKSGDTAKATQLETEGKKWYAYEYEIRKNYIKEHPSSLISARELLMYVNNKTLTESIPWYEALDPKVKSSEQGKELTARIKLLNTITTSKPALPFTQNDVDGHPVSLAAYKGKYVLLEFWASWCGPCRAENPNLHKQMELYGKKGFNILGVSLDKAKEPWVKAIEKDSLTWTQVSDLKGWNNEVAVQYGVKAVPANFLIDPTGKIIAQDLRGEALNAKLKELFQ